MKKEIHKQILDLRLQGFSYKNIIEKTGISSSTVYRVLRKNCVMIAMDRADDLYENSCNAHIDEHIQNQYLTLNLFKAEFELDQRSFKAFSTEKLQTVVRQLRGDLQKLQDKRERELEKCHEILERDEQKRKENQKENKEQDQETDDTLPEEKELAQVPIIPAEIKFEIRAEPEVQQQPQAQPQAQNSPKPATPEKESSIQTALGKISAEEAAIWREAILQTVDSIKPINHPGQNPQNGPTQKAA